MRTLQSTEYIIYDLTRTYIYILLHGSILKISRLLLYWLA